MSKKEITYAKNCALSTMDWDTYQAIIRTCLTPGKSDQKSSRSHILACSPLPSTTESAAESPVTP